MPMGHQMPPLHQIQQQQHLQQPPSQLSTFMQPPGPQPIYHMQPPVPPSSPPNVPVDNTSSPASPRKIRTVRRSIPPAAPSSDSNTVHHCPIPTCGKTFQRHTPSNPIFAVTVLRRSRVRIASYHICGACMMGDGRISCTGCEKSFARADALRRHRETLSAHRCRGVPRPVKEKGDVEVEA
ncbi:hypothetical protein BC829DRAFT_401274 [Chytridium lagenaria]|nr:hypothetical protein BC829DRAFT_401274 [Chytridium lagenaria]